MQKNNTVVNGEEIEFNGETHIIGKMDEEEISEMVKEGEKLLSTKVTYKGNEVELKDIKSGKDLFQITEAIDLQGDLTGMWYVWRTYRMEDRLKNLSPKAQKQIKELLSKKE